MLRVLFYVHWRKLPFIQFYIYIHEKASVPVIIRVKDREQKEQVTKAFHGQCLYQAISPKVKWIIQHDGVRIKL